MGFFNKVKVYENKSEGNGYMYRCHNSIASC